MKYFVHLPMKMEPTVSSETSAIRTQAPGNYPKRNKSHLEHGESIKARRLKGDRAETLAVQKILHFVGSKRGLNFPQDSATCLCRKRMIDSYIIRRRFGHFCHYYSVKSGKSS